MTPTWLDRFPWLEKTLTSVEGWDRPIVDTAEVQTRHNLTKLSEIAMSRLSRWTLGELLPTLPSDVWIESLEFSARAHNVLSRAGINSTEDLATWTVDDILDLRGVGANTVMDILVTFSAAAAHNKSTLEASCYGGSISDSMKIEHTPETGMPLLLGSIANDFTTIAQWFALIGLEDVPMLTYPVPLGTPIGVIDARQRLIVLTATEATANIPSPDASEVLDAEFEVLDQRATYVLRDRMFADSPLTLDAIGGMLGVTRERVRQIESAARTILLGSIERETGPLPELAEAARRTIKELLPLEVLLIEIPSLVKTVKSIDQPAWRVLDRIDDAYEIEDGWCASPTLDAIKSVTAAELEEASDRYGVARIDTLHIVDVDNDEHQITITTKWLEYCGYRMEGPFVYTRTQSVQDYAASILSSGGVALSSEEINARFTIDRSVRSLRNALGRDERFTRVDRDRWALTEWGMDTYSDIRTIIREELSAARGVMPLDTLVENVTSKYAVASSSVITYSASSPFETIGGMVQLAAKERAVRKTPAQTRRMFRRPQAWVLRVTLTKDHLRGSGSIAPIALSTIVDIRRGQSIQLASRLGDQSVMWTGLQPAFGTIRRFLQDLDAAVDDEVFLILNDDHTFSVEMLRLPQTNPIAQALALVGGDIHMAMPDALDTLYAAIEVSVSSGIASLVGAYRDRGDIDIADCILQVRMGLEEIDAGTKGNLQGPEIEELLDLL